jgi:hypothetical protein
MIPAAQTRPKKIEDEGENTMEQTFTLTITAAEHGEWQGRLKSHDNSETSFQSLLELIQQINQKLERNVT